MSEEKINPCGICKNNPSIKEPIFSENRHFREEKLYIIQCQDHPSNLVRVFLNNSKKEDAIKKWNSQNPIGGRH